MGKLTRVGSTLQLLEGSSNSIMINPSSSRLMEGIRTMPQRLVRQDMLREAIRNIRQPVNKQVPISNKLINQEDKDKIKDKDNQEVKDKLLLQQGWHLTQLNKLAKQEDKFHQQCHQDMLVNTMEPLHNQCHMGQPGKSTFQNPYKQGNYLFTVSKTLQKRYFITTLSDLEKWKIIML